MKLTNVNQVECKCICGDILKALIDKFQEKNK